MIRSSAMHPHAQLSPQEVRPITLADMATHTSGLPRELGNAPHGTPHFTFPDYRTRWRWLPNQSLRSIPGTTALYSNVAFDFLSDALQSAALKPYAALLAERTLNPLHMQNTTFFPSAEQCGQLLIGANDQGPCTITGLLPEARASTPPGRIWRSGSSTCSRPATWVPPHTTLPLRRSIFFRRISSAKRD